MLIIPVMYLRGGSVLKPAGAGGPPVKSDPVELANDWFRSGAELMHIVDLDTPPAGPSPNAETMKKIRASVNLPFEVEAHIRAIDTADKYVLAGATRVIVGAAAYQKPAFLEELCRKFTGKIAVAIDVRRGKVLIKGWTVASNKTDLDYVEQFKNAGVDTIFYSNSEEEGLLKATDFAKVRDFLRKGLIKTYHTTDVSSTNDIEQLMVLESYGLQGTLLNRSLYEGRVDLESCITHVKEKSPGGEDEPTFTEEK